MSLALVIVAVVFSVLAFIVSSFALIETYAMKRSTHQVTMIDPAKQLFENMDEGTKNKILKEDYDLI